jgi:hypothetical protein
MLQPVTLDREWLRRRAVKLEEPTRTDELTPAS